MFSPSTMLGNRAPAAAMYRSVHASSAIEEATPHRLVSMLYHAVVGEIAAARGAVARRDVPEKGRAIGHAVRIVEEGLLAPLDLERGGPLAQTLRDLYQYLVYRLTMANVSSDDMVLAECARLAESLRDGWDDIADKAEPLARAA